MNTNDSESKKLKEVMDKERMNWRSFATSNAIKTQWNDPGTPMYYVIDHKGIIRDKWFGNPGERTLDAALETRIKEAEGNGKTTPN